MSKIIPTDIDIGFEHLTPAQRLFLFYYAQCPDIDWAADKAGCSPMTVRKKWLPRKAFKAAFNDVIRGEVTEVIKARARDEAGKSFARIIELRDQNSNPRVALDAAKACLRAIEDPTFQSHVKVTRDIGANWRRVLSDMMSEVKRITSGDIVDAEDWHYVEELPAPDEENGKEVE